jgi:hypothetical protein
MARGGGAPGVGLKFSARIGSGVAQIQKRLRGTLKRGKDDNFTERIPMKVI